MPTIWGLNFWSECLGSLKPWRSKAEKNCGINSPKNSLRNLPAISPKFVRPKVIQKQTTTHDSQPSGITAEKGFPRQKKNAFPTENMHFPAERCLFLQKIRTFLQKNAVFGAHMAGNCRTLQEGFRARESRALANFHKKKKAQPESALQNLGNNSLFLA